MTPLFGSGRKPTLRFEYRALAPSGLIDQCLSIHNRTTAPVVLAARVAMCDSLGQPWVGRLGDLDQRRHRVTGRRRP